MGYFFLCLLQFIILTFFDVFPPDVLFSKLAGLSSPIVEIEVIVGGLLWLDKITNIFIEIAISDDFNLLHTI